MMGYTDRYLRKVLRLLSPDATLYTEMVTANAIVNIQRKGGCLDRWLLQDAAQPVVLQLGGADPVVLAEAASVVADKYAACYQAININCGCPSPRVADSGAFGAQLMYDPDRVAAICEAVSAASGGMPVTVKHRIGVDDHDSYKQLQAFIETISSAGVSHFIVHARKALLGRNFTPAQNRSIPPLHYPTVYALAQDFPSLSFTINGGVGSHSEMQHHLDQGVSGVMVGRAVCKRPWYWRQLPDKEDATANGRQQQSGEGVEGAAGRGTGGARGAGAEAGGEAKTGGRSESKNGTDDGEENQRQSVLTKYLAWAQSDQDRFVDSYRSDSSKSSSTSTASSLRREEQAIRSHQRRVIKPLHNLFANEPGGKRWRGELAQFTERGANSQEAVWSAYASVRGVVQDLKEAKEEAAAAAARGEDWEGKPIGNRTSLPTNSAYTQGQEARTSAMGGSSVG
jgi:tRNA dihydrouridine synthase A